MSISQNFPNTRPSLSLNFARSQILDPRITFTRTTSGTRVGSDGYIEVIPSDQPRFDFDPVTGECLGLMIEEQRNNLWVYSENPESAFFQPELVSFSSNSAIAPDGNLTADKIIAPVGASSASISQGITISSGATLTGSAFVKYADLNRLEIVLLSSNNTTPYARATINPINGTITTAVAAFNGGTNPSASVVSYGNGWYRFSVTVTYPAVTLAGMRVAAFDSGGALGDGTKGTFVWGMQLEVGSFPTSYIPTSGFTVTRTADNARIEGKNFTDFYNQSGFSIFTRHRFPKLPTNYYPRVFDINNGNDSFRLNHYHDPSVFGTKVGSSVVENNVLQSSLSTSAYIIGDDIRMASCFKDNDFASYVNGTLVGTDNSGVFTTTQRNVLYIGSSVNGSSPINGTISQLTYYPVRLPNNVLQTLTK